MKVIIDAQMQRKFTLWRAKPKILALPVFMKECRDGANAFRIPARTLLPLTPDEYFAPTMTDEP